VFIRGTLVRGLCNQCHIQQRQSGLNEKNLSRKSIEQSPDVCNTGFMYRCSSGVETGRDVGHQLSHLLVEETYLVIKRVLCCGNIDIGEPTSISA
jgi:hypothetical protein